MSDIQKLVRLQIAVIILFAFFKLVRPSVLAASSSEWIKVTLLSLPNFFEAILGILVLTAIGLQLNVRVLNIKNQLKASHIYVLALVLTGIYVITQEFKIHNLGGNNVYDKNDILFSIVGLLVGYLIIFTIKPLANQVGD